MMKLIGLDSFRFSISWSRILPSKIILFLSIIYFFNYSILTFCFNFEKKIIEGKLRGGVNPLGVKFYNNVINELLANGNFFPKKVIYSYQFKLQTLIIWDI